MKPLSDETMALLRATLAEYGADYEPEGIRRLADGRQFSVYATTPKGRLQFRRAPSGDLLYSGPVAAATVRGFVERYWYWKPTDGGHHD